MTTTDIDALHAQLDLTPGDQDTRRVLADAYEDEGILWMAEGLRWMASRNISPQYLPGSHYRHSWSDDVSTPDANRLPRAAVGRNLRATHRGRSSYDSQRQCGWTFFHTRREAEEALCRALAQEPAR